MSRSLSRWLFAALLSSGAAIAQEAFVPQTGVQLKYDPNPSTFRIPAPAASKLRIEDPDFVQATFIINFLPAGPGPYGETCVAWNGSAQVAFSYAANLWSTLVQSAVPIRIDACYSNSLGAGTLGAAGPATFYRNFTNAPQASTWYPVALANSLAGTDLNTSIPDIYAVFSSTFNWYYGTDANTPPGQLDFVSVVMHEIGHGLGFTGSMEVVGGQGSWGSSGSPFAYDRFTENGAGTALINTASFSNPSAALGSALTSNSVFFDGPNANAGNGGARVPLYAPATWNDGSSYSHLAESFNGTPNALMTFSLSSGEAAHNPGPVTLGMFSDMGWVLMSANADLSLAQTVNANPASTGRDAVFTMSVTNTGPGSASGVSVTAAYDNSATVVWVAPGCSAVAATYVCTVGALASGATRSFRVVLRKNTVGTVFNNATAASGSTDPNAANNTANLSVPVNASPAAAQVQRYRLYSPVTLEHHFTTDLNEYTVLGGLVGTWVQEGTVGRVLNNPGQFNGVTAVPYYRLYDNNTRWHHWTTDANEYYTLGLFPGWIQEGVDGWILPTSAPGSVQLFRLLYPFVGGLHHWTIDTNEYNVLTTSFGWIGEGGSGFVIP